MVELEGFLVWNAISYMKIYREILLLIEKFTYTRCMNSTLSCRLTYIIMLSERVDTLSTGAMAESVSRRKVRRINRYLHKLIGNIFVQY